MFKKLFTSFQPFRLILILILVLGGVFLLNHQIGQSNSMGPSVLPTYPVLPTRLMSPSPTHPSQCVSLPNYSSNNNLTLTSTPTPGPNQQAVIPVSPSVTPIAYAHTIDLDPKSNLYDKTTIIIYRCDGTYDMFQLGSQNSIKDIPLSEGDIILHIDLPQSVAGKHPLPTLGLSPTVAPIGTATKIPSYP